MQYFVRKCVIVLAVARNDVRYCQKRIYIIRSELALFISSCHWALHKTEEISSKEADSYNDNSGVCRGVFDNEDQSDEHSEKK